MRNRPLTRLLSVIVETKYSAINEIDNSYSVCNSLHYYAADGSHSVQQDALQPEDDSVQKTGKHKLNYSNESERSTRLR